MPSRLVLSVTDELCSLIACSSKEVRLRIARILTNLQFKATFEYLKAGLQEANMRAAEADQAMADVVDSRDEYATLFPF